MKQIEWKKLPEYTNENENKMNEELEVGDFFLYGVSMIAQRQNKKVGQEICYYRLVGKTQNGIEYAPVFDVLEQDKIGGKS